MSEGEPAKPVFGPWTQWIDRNIDRWIAVAKLTSIGGGILAAMLWTLGIVRFRVVLLFVLLYALQAAVTGLLFGLAMGIDIRRGRRTNGPRHER